MKANEIHSLSNIPDRCPMCGIYFDPTIKKFTIILNPATEQIAEVCGQCYMLTRIADTLHYIKEDLANGRPK